MYHLRTDDGQAISHWIDSFSKNPDQASVRDREREREREGERGEERKRGKERGRERGEKERGHREVKKRKEDDFASKRKMIYYDTCTYTHSTCDLVVYTSTRLHLITY